MKKDKPKYVKEKVEIDWDLVDLYLKAGSTGEDIWPMIGVASSTLRNRCIHDHGMTLEERSSFLRKAGEDCLRLKQYTTAMDGNIQMLIWLGKNRLQQRESPIEAEVSKTTIESFASLMSLIKDKQIEYLKNDFQDVGISD